MNLSLDLAFSLLAITFSAGGFFYQVRQIRKDVNGIGRKLNTLQSDLARVRGDLDNAADREHLRTSLMVAFTVKAEDQARVLALMERKP